MKDKFDSLKIQNLNNRKIISELATMKQNELKEFIQHLMKDKSAVEMKIQVAAFRCLQQN